MPRERKDVLGGGGGIMIHGGCAGGGAAAHGADARGSCGARALALFRRRRTNGVRASADATTFASKGRD